MWQQYRKTFLPVQILVALIVGACLLVFHMPLQSVLVAFVLPMELAAFLGAAWSSRLKRKVLSATANDRLRRL